MLSGISTLRRHLLSPTGSCAPLAYRGQHHQVARTWDPLSEICPRHLFNRVTRPHCTHLMRKDPDAGKDRRQEKGTTEDEMIGWHHQLDGHEFEQAQGAGDGQGSLACCSPCGCRVRHNLATEQQEDDSGCRWLRVGYGICHLGPKGHPGEELLFCAVCSEHYLLRIVFGA